MSLVQVSVNDGKRYTFVRRKTILVGRHSGCDLVVDDPRISRKQLALGFEKEGFWLIPVSETIPMKINDDIEAAGAVELFEGDVVTFGNNKMKITVLSIDGNNGIFDFQSDKLETSRRSLGAGELPSATNSRFQCSSNDTAKTPRFHYALNHEKMERKSLAPRKKSVSFARSVEEFENLKNVNILYRITLLLSFVVLCYLVILQVMNASSKGQIYYDE